MNMRYALLLVFLLAGCASSAASKTRLPFHVAILPPTVVRDPQLASSQREGSATEMELAIDGEALAPRLRASLSGAFAKVTMLASGAGGTTSMKQWAQAARDAGADVMLVPQLSYAPSVHTSLNDRFWLNLPLFAIGGPLEWFVADRSYYCDSELEGLLIDVSSACADTVRSEAIEDDARILDASSQAREASLNFLARADGVMPYLVSLLVPAGLLARETGSVRASLDEAVMDQVARSLAASLVDRASSIERWRGVCFHPRSVAVQTNGTNRALRGEIWLEPGAATGLLSVRHRLVGGTFADAAWQETSRTAPTANTPGRVIYEFEVPLAAAGGADVQLEIQQNDRFGIRRTFTFPVK